MSDAEWDSDWLIFSKRARNGAFVLLFLFVLIAVLPRIYRNYIQQESLAPKIKEIATARALDREKTGDKEESLDEEQFTIPKQPFDPNHLTKAEWMEIGLTEKQAGSIQNYLNTGAALEVKSDVAKLYAINDELYDKLYSQIDLPETKNEPTDDVNTKEYNEPSSGYSEEREVEEDIAFPIAINTASRNELEAVPGIGAYYAKEIIDLRRAYGGILSMDQLKDFYKMTPDKLDSLSTYLTVDPEHVERKNVNAVSLEELVSHPDITSDMAKSIIYLRENYGPFDSVDQLLQSPYIDREKLDELKPYIATE